MHNKLQVVDGAVGVVGGRNIADRYFDYDTNYLFKDRDVVVYGPAVREMRASFEWFWTSPRTVPVQHLRDVASVLLNSEPGPLPPYQPPARLRSVLAEIGGEASRERVKSEDVHRENLSLLDWLA